MEPKCVFRSKTPVIQDSLKWPEQRFLCRCAARLKIMKTYWDRFIGVDICEHCEYRKETAEETEIQDVQGNN